MLNKKYGMSMLYFLCALDNKGMTLKRMKND